MLTIEDLGITTNLPFFCKDCKFDTLILDDTKLYSDDSIYIRRHNVSCRYVDICLDLYGRLQKQEDE